MSTLRVIDVQHPSASSANLILDSSGNVTAAGTVAMASPFGMRNKIINGAMEIDQRNDGASVTPTGAVYTLDRWYTNLTQASKFSVQRNAGSITPPLGFRNYLGVTSLSAYSVLSSDVFAVIQSIEGYNVVDLGWGAAGAQSVTLSFWVRSSLTGTFGGSLNNSAFNRAYPFSYTINAANTWEKKTITVTGDTTGTWLTDSGVGVYIFFNLGAGASQSGTAGAWAASGALAPTGATSVVGTNGATFYLTGVQLEVGSVATPFERRLFPLEFSMCQRYYEAGSFYEVVGVNNSSIIASVYTSVKFTAQKRIAPTITGTSGQGTFSAASITADQFGAGRSNAVANRINSGTYTADAEL